jgi:hypothetical protein
MPMAPMPCATSGIAVGSVHSATSLPLTFSVMWSGSHSSS